LNESQGHKVAVCFGQPYS